MPDASPKARGRRAINPKFPLSAIADQLGKNIEAVRTAAKRKRFPTEKSGNQLVADIDKARAYFETAKVGKRAKK